MDKLLATEDSSTEDVDFDAILGRTSATEWVEEKDEEVKVNFVEMTVRKCFIRVL